MVLAEKNYRQYHKRRRSRTLLVQACLGVLIVALLFGISYAAVMLLHGMPVLPTAAASAFGALGAPAKPAGAVPASSGAVDSGGEPQPPESEAPGAAAPENAAALDGMQAGDAFGARSWNVAAPLSVSDEPVTASDSRLLALPVNGRLSTEYFRSVLFIGDSLSQGFALYAPTRDVATVCAYKSTSPHQVLQNYVGQRWDGDKIEMWDEINIQTPGNIYVLYGTNALLAQSEEAFLKYYGDLLDKLRERFPDVPIYVQSITPTTAAEGARRPALENGHIRAVNNAIAQMAVSKGMYYLDAQEALADSDGNLRADYTGRADGIHMNPTGYAAWADYILTHTVHSAANEQYVTEGPYA